MASNKGKENKDVNHMDGEENKKGNQSTKDNLKNLPEWLTRNFLEAEELIKTQFALLGKQENILNAAEQKALSEIDICFDRFQQVINRRKQLLKREVSERSKTNQIHTLGQKDKLLLCGMMLDTLLKQTSDLISTCETKNRESFEKMVSKEIDKHCKTALEIEFSQGCVTFDKTAEAAQTVEQTIRSIGRIRNLNVLPFAICIEEKSAIVGLPSKVTLKVMDRKGDAINLSSIQGNDLTLRLKDKEDEYVQYKTAIVQEEKLVVNFVPLSATVHTMSVFFLSFKLKELEINIEENIPIKCIGQNEGLIQPNAICIIKDDLICVADSCACKLFIFSSDSTLQSEINLQSNNFVPFDLVFSFKKNIIVCTGLSFDDQDDTLSASPDDVENESFHDCPEELSYENEPSTASLTEQSSNTEPMPKPDKSLKDQQDIKSLKFSKTKFQDMHILYIESNSYVTVLPDSVVLSDPNQRSISLYTFNGDFIQLVSTPDMDCPSCISCREDGRLIVADIGKNCLWTGYPEFGLQEKWATVETESKQLACPIAMSVDGNENLLVADGSEPKIFIYGEWGEFVSYFKISPPLLETEPTDLSKSSLFFNIWSVAVVKNSLWVIDNQSHKVFVYHYKPPI